ncbi:MAG: Sporulation uncharacterized protein YkwD [Pelotomaculum thermopropionicum]|uniref:Sporulation uncharacterized protein YkwD n=1 Tax=Pelotomaculum thermopropionicum TaxID=110500 RepID=A0A101HRA6_9FIRM|nr:MAG: Sporulation uncharacterized protein YkwD [Pelotomaculum thermopropionicum]
MQVTAKQKQWLYPVVIMLLLVFMAAFSIAAPANAAGLQINGEEQELVDLVNQARADAGLAPLAVDPLLNCLAKIKAQEMSSAGRLSNYTSMYGSLGNLLKMARVDYVYAGESLVRATSVRSAFTALIHTANFKSKILSQKFEQTGVGIITRGYYKYVVQIYTGNREVTSPEPQPHPQPEPDTGLNADEQKMLDLVNRERINAGLSPLEIDLSLVKLSRMKAQDMIDQGYFSHNSPTYGSPFDMMRTYGIQYRYAGENLAGAPTVYRAHNSLMNSSGHRANILGRNFTGVGIGIVNGGPYGKIFVQLFTG